MHTKTVIKLAEHRIEYTGLNRKDANEAGARARKAGRNVDTDIELVTGSTDIWHYTVWSFAR